MDQAERPSALDPRGSGAESIADLWWYLFAAGAVVYVVVLVALAIALRRRRRAEPQAGDPRVALLVGGAVLPAIVITATFIVTVRPDGPLFAMSGPSALTVDVTGHQFWWSVRYPDRGIVTANELHIPVGVPVELRLRSADVVHSFWVPQLNGKRDLLPGKTNTLRLEASAPGVYRGECAEFCGVQHAKMQLLVVAEPPEEFDAWAARTRLPAAEPATAAARRGRRTFLRSGCGVCHRIAGTEAEGTVGPDLTHLGSRLTLGAATIPNTRGHLGGWVVDSQSIKPGNAMPPQPVPADDLPDLLTYLEELR